jgi:hypothetical protein
VQLYAHNTVSSALLVSSLPLSLTTISVEPRSTVGGILDAWR